MEWAKYLIPRCPKCSSVSPYRLSTRNKYSCRECGHQYSNTSSGPFAYNKIPLEKIDAIAKAVASGASCLSVSRRFGVQVNTVYKIRDRARL